MNAISIIGAGLAGSEAAWQLASRGIPVEIFEMRPAVMSKAHKTGLAAELVCSNSFRGAALSNAVGLLKEELRTVRSLIMEAADVAAVPAGGALAVDRVAFSAYVDEKLRTHPLIKFIEGEVTEVLEHSPDKIVIIATGPLTSNSLFHSIENLASNLRLSFFDAISPIILGESIDLSVIFRASRYDKGDDDYLNIPLTKEQYLKFIEDILGAEKYGGKAEVESDSIEGLRPFEGCMPIEEMAERGTDTLRFGPLKPVGLIDEKTGFRPYAVIQLRQDDKAGHLWSMVGMQTRMKHGEQERIFRSLPGLQNAEFVRLGSVHRNSFLDSPKLLNATGAYRDRPGLFFAGQMTGVEGYVESTASGFVAGINAYRLANNLPLLEFPTNTAIGSLQAYISDETRNFFQPMNISFGLMPCYSEALASAKAIQIRVDKKATRETVSAAAISSLNTFYELHFANLGGPTKP